MVRVLDAKDCHRISHQKKKKEKDWHKIKQKNILKQIFSMFNVIGE